MTDSSTAGGTPSERRAANVAYTLAAVNQYLDDVAARRAELERAITAARGRTVRAELAIKRLSALERAVGASLVAGYAQQVSVARRLGSGPVREAPAEHVIDLRDGNDAPTDARPETDPGFAGLAGEAPAGFGDEFFGPLPIVRINGSRPVSEVRHG